MIEPMRVPREGDQPAGFDFPSIVHFPQTAACIEQESNGRNSR